MRKVNHKIKSKRLEVLFLNLIAELDEAKVDVGCSAKTLGRIKEYSRKTDTIPPLWNEENHTFVGVKVVLVEPFEDNILVVSPTCEKIVWLED
jgi:hypothetical protein